MMNMWAVEVVTVTSRVLSRGGALMLLPFIAYSFSPYEHAGLQFGYSMTDNVNQLNIREAGQIAHINPQFIYSGVLELDYIGEFSLINFDFTNLLVVNDVKIAKKILLPGIGNNTAIYIDLYNFYTPSYEQYRITNVIAGHSLNAYLGNHLFSSENGRGHIYAVALE